MNISKEGIEFVLEIYKIKTAIISFLNVLLPLVFISVLIGMLNYFKITFSS